MKEKYAQEKKTRGKYPEILTMVNSEWKDLSIFIILFYQIFIMMRYYFCNIIIFVKYYFNKIGN